MRRAPVGFRIRSARRALGLTQAELAKRAGISPSYLNLIEANKREIGGTLVQKIAALLEVEADTLTGRAESRMIADLREVALEPLLRHIDLSPDLAPDMVGRHPEWSRALLTLYRAWRDQAAIANALADKLNQDPAYGNAVHQMLSHVTAIRSSSEILDEVSELDDVHHQRFHDIIATESHRLAEMAPRLMELFDQSGNVFRPATPADEVDDFMLQHDAWFPALEQAGEALRRTIGGDGRTDEAALLEYLQSTHGTTASRVGADSVKADGYRNLMRFDADANHITFLSNAAAATRRFQLARHIARIEAVAAIEAQVDDPLLTSDAARERARQALSSYVAGALIFPYDEVLQAAGACRYDINVLSQRYDASYEQICHRLVTLRDPQRAGVPFAFLRSDPAPCGRSFMPTARRAARPAA